MPSPRAGLLTGLEKRTLPSRLPHQARHTAHLLLPVKKLLNTFYCSTTLIIDQDFPVQDAEASLPPTFVPSQE